jgi:hypothetical protein
VAAAHRQHVVGADEDVDLAEHQLVADQLDRLHHREQRVAVFLDLRALVAAAGVLDGQFVQAELLLHLLQLPRLGVEQRDPDEAIGPLDEIADGLDRNVRQFFAVLVGHAVNQHTVSMKKGHAAPRSRELT